METPDISSLLSQFDQLSNVYLHKEVEQALTCREAITPHLLAIIEEAAANPLRHVLEEHNSHVYAASLLGHFGEPAAHLPLIRAFSVAEEQLIDLWGDMTTETLPTLLYRTSDGSITAIQQLIVNPEVDQYVRCAATESLSYVVAFAPERRAEIVTFLTGLVSTATVAPAGSHFWGNLVATLCDLHPGESMAVIRKAYEDGLVPPTFIALDDVDEANAKTPEEARERLQNWVKSRMPADVHGYISWFAEFHQDEVEQFKEPVHDKPKAKKQQEKPKNKTAKKVGKKK